MAIGATIAPDPRIRRCVAPCPEIRPITPTGSYQLVGYSPYATLPSLSYEADGATEIRKQVRHLVQLGADLIKIYVEAADLESARFSACLQAWQVCNYWPTVIAVEKGSV